MKKTIFTDTYIKKLKPVDAKYTRSEGNGFTVRVMPSGVKTFLYLYTINGKRREMALGHYDPDFSDATGRGSLAVLREKFEDARRKVNKGIDPLEEEEHERRERQLAPTVADLADEYLEKWAKPRKRSWEADKRTLDVEIVPKWAKRKAKEIKRRDVVLLLEEIAKRAPVMANRTRALLSKLFNFALEREIVEVNPCTGVKPAVKEEPTTRSLSEDEIREVWTALETPGVLHVSPEIARCIKLILLTGQRPGEVVGMHTAEIDGAWWTIPAERAKNGREHRVYLTQTAREIIGDTSGLVFESPRGGKAIAVNALAHVTRRNVARPTEAPIPSARIEETDQEEPATIRRKLIMQPWTPHDLRRTTATKLSELGYTDEIIDAVLNHKKKGIVATYNRNRYDKEKQTALEAWERKLQQIVTGRGRDNVVSIDTAKGNRKAA